MEFGISPKGSDLFDNNVKTNFNNNIFKIGIVIAIILIFIISLIITYFKIIKPKNIKYSNNISISGISIKNSSKSEIIESLKNKFEQRKNTQFTINVDDFTTIISGQELQFNYDYEKTYDEAKKVEQDLIKNKKSNESVNIPIMFSLNEETLRRYISNISYSINGKKDFPYIIDMEKLEVTILKNQQYSFIEEELIKSKLINNYTEDTFNNNIFLQSKKETYTNIDLNKIYTDISKKPRNAYISNNKIIKEEYGIEFEVPLQNAIAFDSTASEPYILKLKKVKPEILSDTLIEKKEVVKTETIFSKNFSLASLNNESIKYISNVIDVLDNTILNKDQTFSFNDAINIRNYSSNINSTEVNNALSFVASTIYVASLNTNQNVLERHAHKNAINFIDLGLDTQISIENDFKFKNSSQGSLKLKFNISNNNLNISLVGNKLDKKYTVITENVENLNYNTVRVFNPAITGERVKQKGFVGGNIIVSLITSDLNGTNSSKKKVSENKYYPLPEIIEYNNGEPNNNQNINNNYNNNFINLN